MNHLSEQEKAGADSIVAAILLTVIVWAAIGAAVYAWPWVAK